MIGASLVYGIVYFMKPESTILITKRCEDYELIDSGDGEKLERFGSIILRRPDPQALWNKGVSLTQWHEATAFFDKQWKGRKNIPDTWDITIDGKRFELKLSAFKHVGLFPEQRENWNWIESVVSRTKEPISVLNLFGYTGGATLSVLKAGGSVVHVDGSKTALSWAKRNAELSGLSEKSVRWILDDVLTFVKREVKRGHQYDAVIMDPPAFGHGPDGEVWKIEKHLPELIGLLSTLLSEKPLFVLVNGYAAGYSELAYGNLLKECQKTFGGSIEAGQVTIEETESKRLLPAGIFARWNSAL